MKFYHIPFFLKAGVKRSYDGPAPLEITLAPRVNLEFLGELMIPEGEFIEQFFAAMPMETIREFPDTDRVVDDNDEKMTMKEFRSEILEKYPVAGIEN